MAEIADSGQVLLRCLQTSCMMDGEQFVQRFSRSLLSTALSHKQVNPVTPLCNRPSGTRPSGFFSPTQWKFSLPTTQRIFFFTQPFLCFPSDCTLHTQRIFANKQKIKII